MSQAASQGRQLAAAGFKAWGLLVESWQQAGYVVWSAAVELAHDEKRAFAVNSDVVKVKPTVATAIHAEMWQCDPPTATKRPLPSGCVSVRPDHVAAVHPQADGVRVVVELAVHGPVVAPNGYAGRLLDDHGNLLADNIEIYVP